MPYKWCITGCGGIVRVYEIVAVGIEPSTAHKFEAIRRQKSNILITLSHCLSVFPEGDCQTLNIKTVLLIAERDGQRCAGPVLIAGVAVGVGVIQLSIGTLKESSPLSLQMLSLLVLELMGPLLVSVLGMALLLPRWIDRVAATGRRAWRRSVPGAALIGIVLMLMFFSASLLAGTLVTPRSELGVELMALLAKTSFFELLRSLLRSAGFLAALCAWCQWRAQGPLRQGHRKTYIVSNLLMEGLMIGIGLKLIWFLVAQILPLQELIS